MNRSLIACVLVMLLAACSEPAQQALGTLEYDRITLPAPAAERIVEIAVREGFPQYRTVCNNGAQAGQTVFHLHIHIIAGRPFVSGLFTRGLR